VSNAKSTAACRQRRFENRGGRPHGIVTRTQLDRMT